MELQLAAQISPRTRAHVRAVLLAPTPAHNPNPSPNPNPDQVNVASKRPRLVHDLSQLLRQEFAIARLPYPYPYPYPYSYPYSYPYP